MRIFIVESYTIQVYSIYCFHFYGKMFLAGGTNKYDTKHKGLCGIPLCSNGGPPTPPHPPPGRTGFIVLACRGKWRMWQVQSCYSRYVTTGMAGEQSSRNLGPESGEGQWRADCVVPLHPSMPHLAPNPYAGVLTPLYFRNVTEFGDRAFRR